MAFTCADAKVFTYPALNCRCTIPDDWTYHSRIGCLLCVDNFEHKKFFTLKACPGDLAGDEDKNLENGVTRDLDTDGYVISALKRVKVRNIDFNRMDAAKDMGNKSYHVDVYFAIVEGNIYIFIAAMYDGDPSGDNELNGILGSFDFIRPPIPSPREPSDFSEPILSPQTAPASGETD